MHDLPVFTKKLPPSLTPKHFFQYDPFDFNKQLEELLENESFEIAYQKIGSVILELESLPNQACMTRHLLESMASTLLLLDSHRLQAASENLPDPKELILKFVHVQMKMLTSSYFFDKSSFSIQSKGIPIFCQDVPVIKWK
jgi:hypothetical protein